MQITPMIGKRFGRLTVLRISHRDKALIYHYVCKCDCGNKHTVSGAVLRRGVSKSCGCLRKELTSISSRKHGDSAKRIYRVYSNMFTRCTNPNYHGHNCYAGVEVCEEWRNDYLEFKKWALENGYTDEMTIDRIDPDGDYTPKNCQFLTRSDHSKKTIRDIRERSA